MKPRDFAVLMLAVGLAATVAAWTPPERVDRKPDNYVTYGNDIAVGPDGTPHIVWSECPRETYLEMIKYSRRDSDTWTIPINISRDSGDLRNPAIVVDTTGVPLVAWSEQYSARIRYTRLAGDTWLTPKLAFSRSGVVPRLTVDVGNRIHMLFGEVGGSHALLYSAYCQEADSWTTPTVAADDSADMGWHDLTADRNGRLHAVWMNYGTYGVDYSTFDGDSWSTPERLPDPAPSGQSCDPRIACDSQGRPHVVWEERSGGYWVYYSFRDGDSWTTPYRVYDQRGGRPEICSDEDNRLHVVWNWTYGLRHRTRTAGAWNDPVVVTNDSSAMLQEIALSPGRLHLSFRMSWNVFYSTHPAAGSLFEEDEAQAMRWLQVAVGPGAIVLHFAVQERCEAKVSLWDSAGRLVLSRSLGQLEPGCREVRVSVGHLPGGAYVCRLEAGGGVSAAKTVIIK